MNKQISKTIAKPTAKQMSKPIATSIAISIALINLLFANPEANAANCIQASAATNQQANAATYQQANAANNQQQNIARAQQNTFRAQQVWSGSQQTPTRSATEFQSQTLTQMVELPELPQYTGQMTFVTGTCFPYAKSGSSYTMKLRTLEFQESVRDWYQASLEQTGWKIEKAMCNGKTVAAWKGKLLVQIIVMPPSHQRFRSDVLIRYRSGG